ncbi:MAG: HEAT repeat domain-containing protein, partial [Verrucomicrobiota bacterium]
MKRTLVPLCLSLLLAVPSFAQRGDRGDPKAKMKLPADFDCPPAPVVPPEEALDTFVVAPGLKLELVAAEPLVNDPVDIAWDADGRMWVAEMTGYMPDVDGRNENDPVGHIAILEDTDGDDIMDQRTVFLDKLVLPRALCFVGNGLLWADQFNLYFSEINNDKGGEPQMVRKGWTGGGNVEHKPNGLMPALDNWLYNAKSSKRIRRINGEWVEEATGGRGQWGLAQDNYGRLVSNGNSSNYRMEMMQPNILRRNPHVNVGIPSFGGSNRVWPSRPNTGINRGYRKGMLTEDGRLRGFTAACGLTIYRGDNFPPEFIGNIFTPEPSAHLVKRNIVEEDNGRMTGRFAYDNKEFLTCTDERSRIVNAYTGPDGCLYFLDMYRGILQHRTYVTSYLRHEILSRGLDKPLGLGRIYRVVHKDRKPGPRPNMLRETSRELVAHLAHPNGWWRDKAQQLLVRRNDSSVVPDLNRMAGHDHHLAVIHALWTLEGMNALNLDAIRNALGTEHPKARMTAIRMAELLGSAEALAALESAMDDPGYEIQRQLALSLGRFESPKALELLSAVLEKNPDRFFRDAAMTGLAGREFAFLDPALKKHPEMVGPLIASMARSGEATVLARLDMIAGSLEPGPRRTVYQALGATAIETGNLDILQNLFGKLSDDLALEDKRIIVKAMADKQNKRQVIRLKSMPDVFADLAALNDKTIEKHLDRFKRNFRFDKAVSYIVTPAEKEQYTKGKTHYQALCAACHHANGTGMPNMAPPLVGSEWVTESENRLIALT